MAMKKDFIQFDQVVERGAGMDVHKEIIVVTIRGKGIKTQTKSFKTFTSSLKKLQVFPKSGGSRQNVTQGQSSAADRFET